MRATSESRRPAGRLTVAARWGRPGPDVRREDDSRPATTVVPPSGHTVAAQRFVGRFHTAIFFRVRVRVCVCVLIISPFVFVVIFISTSFFCPDFWISITSETFGPFPRSPPLRPARCCSIVLAGYDWYTCTELNSPPSDGSARGPFERHDRPTIPVRIQCNWKKLYAYNYSLFAIVLRQEDEKPPCRPAKKPVPVTPAKWIKSWHKSKLGSRYATRLFTFFMLLPTLTHLIFTPSLLYTRRPHALIK